MVQKNRKQLINFIFWNVGLSCSLDVFYGGQGIGKLQLFKKRFKKISVVFKCLVIKTPGSVSGFNGSGSTTLLLTINPVVTNRYQIHYSLSAGFSSKSWRFERYFCFCLQNQSNALPNWKRIIYGSKISRKRNYWTRSSKPVIRNS